jgi:cysteine desulfurase / selenocysteine lyase
MRANVLASIDDISALRADFPILKQTNRGKPVVYLDSASSTQKPQQVVAALSQFYLRDYANIHRGIYELSERATDLYEATRIKCHQFINSAEKDEIVFVRGTTEGINLVAQSLAELHQWHTGDEIILSEMEHHSNIVPWHFLREKLGIIIKVIPVTDDGAVDIVAYQQLFSSRTKLVAITHASNVLGTINPVKEMTAIAHQHHALVLVDGAQAVPHMPVNVQELNCDFYLFSGHKLYAPTGNGVLYGKKILLDKMPPYQGGGGMIETVSFNHVTYAKAPHKFEAGTPDIAGVVGLGAALDYINAIGMDAIFAHEQALLTYAEEKLNSIPGLKIFGTHKPKVGVISFALQGIHPHDLGTVLDSQGVAIRAGHHCAMPLMERFQVPAMVRASLGIYNNEQDVDALVDGINIAREMFALV